MLGKTAYNYRLDILILTSFVQGGLLQKKSIAVAMLGRSKWTRARSVATTPSNCGLASICNGHNSIASSPYPHHFQLNTGSVVRQNKKSTAVAMLGNTAYNYRLDILILTSFVQGGLLQKKAPLMRCLVEASGLVRGA